VREEGGARTIEMMVGGFPLRLKGMARTSRPKPVNNIADLRKGMLDRPRAKPQWRCLIPFTHFVEAEGRKDAHMVQREGPADRRMGRTMSLEPISRNRRPLHGVCVLGCWCGLRAR
jgi:hypothetical protein